MFKNSDAWSSFSVNDVEVAKAFYGETLGLAVTDGDEGGINIKLGNGATVYVYPKPNHEPATFTVLNFAAPDVEQAVDALTARGVRMEHYDMPDFKTDAKGIVRMGEGAAVIAWFKDPAGNVLAVINRG